MKFSSIIAILILILFVTGCNKPEFKPSANLELDRNSITIKDNTVSEDFITATITRMDNENINTILILKFPEDLPEVYFTNVDGKKIMELSTKTLRGINSEDTSQFKIFGENGNAVESIFYLKVELWWNDTKIENQDKVIKIVVKD